MKDHILREDMFFQKRDKSRTWQRYCGFLDLSVSEFLDIQEGLLLEQIDLVAESALGRTIMKGKKPTSVEEFRKSVPLTRYSDYAPYIGNGQEDSLAEKPSYWVHTSWSEGAFKRVPWSEQFVKVQLRNIIAALILSSADRKGDIRLAPGCRILAILPEKPFVSAQLAFGLVEQFSALPVLPLELSEKLPFQKKIDAALKQALSTDIDYIISMTSSFRTMERGFHSMVESEGLFSMMRRANPLVSSRLLKNRLRRLFKQNEKLLPRDLWPLKGIVAWGADSDAFRDTINKIWGKPMLQFYSTIESGPIGMQDWQKDKLSFLPDSVFLEFLPWEESKNRDSTSTVLLNELEENKLYELVITSFYGMPFLRYRLGDMVKIVSSESERASGEFPKMVYHSRADDVIDLFGIARPNTKTVREALELTGIPHGNWGMRKEYEGGQTVLRLYIELEHEAQPAKLAHLLHRKLKVVDRHYLEAVAVMAYNPLRVVPLANGAFARCCVGNRRNELDPEPFKMTIMNLADSMASKLLQV